MRLPSLLLALACASASAAFPAGASASVAAFPKPASGVEAQIPEESVRSTPNQPAGSRRENRSWSPETAAETTNDPINNRDPTGEQSRPPRVRINVRPEFEELERLLLQARLKTLAQVVPEHVRHGLDQPRIGPPGRTESIETLRTRVRDAEQAATRARYESLGPAERESFYRALPRSERRQMEEWAEAAGLRLGSELNRRAEEINEQLVAAGIVHPMRAVKLPVGVGQSNAPGAPRVVAVGDLRAYEAIASGRFQLRPGEVLGPRPQFDPDTGRLLPESHVEALVAQGPGGRIGTYPVQCSECAGLMRGGPWVHENPRVIPGPKGE